MRLHSEAAAQAYSPSNPTEGPGGKPCGTLQAMETPYVVRSHAVCQTHAELPCWEFTHPRPDLIGGQGGEATGPAEGMGGNGTGSTDDDSNKRSARLVFSPDPSFGAGCGSGYGPFDSAVAAMSMSATAAGGGLGGTAAGEKNPSSFGTAIHGFLGTFHSTLYQSPLSEKDVSVISIAPSSFSTGMFSWFPLYFPLREPLHVPDGASVGVTLWRRTEGGENSSCEGRVWYEWCAEVATIEGGSPGSGGGEVMKVLDVSPVHNPNGRSYHVRL